MIDWVLKTPDYYAMITEIATLHARAEAAERERAKLRADNERLRGALEGLMLSRDASWTGGHDWQEALEAAAAALAGEGEVGDE